MPGAIIRNPTPEWLKPEHASVFDSYWKQIARKIGHAIGADDPAAQVMTPLMTEASAAGTALSGAAQAVVDAAKEMPGAQRLATWIRAFHGSPHDFDQFSTTKIGTGEGAQAYGHGLYFAEKEGTAKAYRDDLGKVVNAFGGQATRTPAEDMAHTVISRLRPNSTADDALRMVDEWADAGVFRGKNEGATILDVKRAIADNYGKPLGKTVQGHMYEVNIKADPAHFLDWDKPFSAQSPQAQQALIAAMKKRGLPLDAQGVPLWVQRDPTGEAMHAALASVGASDREGQAAAAQLLTEAGIPGIKYLDQGSRAVGEGTRNYVVHDDKLIDILRKYGVLPPVAGLGYLSQVGQPQKPEPR